MKLRQINHIDITKPVPESEDPTKFKSEKTNKGPLASGFEVYCFFIFYIYFGISPYWILQKEIDPIMCAYKLITVDFRYFGIQTRMENFILSVCIIWQKNI